MEKRLVKGVSLFRSSKYRQRVLSCLEDGPMTTSEIARSIGIRLNHVSMVLLNLKNNGLALCLNEENKRGRLYELTELGKQVVSHEKRSSK